MSHERATDLFTRQRETINSHGCICKVKAQVKEQEMIPIENGDLFTGTTRFSSNQSK